MLLRCVVSSLQIIRSTLHVFFIDVKPFAIISMTITTAITVDRHGDKLWAGCSLACLVASRSHFAITRWPS